MIRIARELARIADALEAQNRHMQKASEQAEAMAGRMFEKGFEISVNHAVSPAALGRLPQAPGD